MDRCSVIADGEQISSFGIHHCKGKDQPGKVANPARGQRNRENEFFPVPVRA